MAVMVNNPFTKWYHKSEVTGKHASKPIHLAALQEAKLFMSSTENPQTTISALIDTKRAANITENRHILKFVAETVLYCGRQCIALRGREEKLESLATLEMSH